MSHSNSATLTRVWHSCAQTSGSRAYCTAAALCRCSLRKTVWSMCLSTWRQLSQVNGGMFPPWHSTKYDRLAALFLRRVPSRCPFRNATPGLDMDRRMKGTSHIYFVSSFQWFISLRLICICSKFCGRVKCSTQWKLFWLVIPSVLEDRWNFVNTSEKSDFKRCTSMLQSICDHASCTEVDKTGKLPRPSTIRFRRRKEDTSPTLQTDAGARFCRLHQWGLWRQCFIDPQTRHSFLG